MPTTILWIALGSALGGAARYWVSGIVAERIGETFPWGTFVVNVVGSTLIGLIATVSGPEGRLLIGSVTRQFIIVGIMGGFTTFSSFSLQTLALMQNGEWGAAAFNIAGSVVLCLLGVWAGHALGLTLNR